MQTEREKDSSVLLNKTVDY